MDFFHFWKHYYGLWAGILARNYGYKVNMPYWCICFLHTSSFCLHKTLILWTGVIWLLVDYFDFFSSCLDFHSHDTHSLQEEPLMSRRCKAKFLKICSVKKHYGTIPLNNCSDFIWGFFLYCWYVKHIPTLFLWVPGGFLFHGLQIELQ